MGADAMEMDGIFLSPDFKTKKGTPVELKTTRIGRKRLDSHDFPTHWVEQLMGYCYGLDVDEGDLMILTLIHPELLNYHIRFEPRELGENWGRILGHSETLKLALVKRIPPDGSYDWQCKSCRYRLRCQIDKGGQADALSKKDSTDSE